MTWNHHGRILKKIGIVGSGQIGPDIALYFTKVLAPHGVGIVVNDIAQSALDNGLAKLKKKVDRGVKSGAFKPDQAKAMLDNLTFTTDKGELSGAEFVIEAATEDLNIKRKIIVDLEEICSPNTILASNSSHLEPEVIFKGARHPGRSLVNHYFFPAERNPLVEVVPGKQTDAAVTEFCMKFYESIGKVPIRVGSRYGYAIDPIFEGLFLAALLIADKGIASPQEIDAVARKALGLGVGPFTAMNLTGGTPLTRVGLGHYHDKIMPWFHVPDSMKDRADPWPAAARGEKIDVEEKKFAEVARRLKGAYLGLCAEVLDSGITNVSDLDMAVEIGLVMKAPFRMMNKEGVGASLKLVEDYASENPGFKVAPSLKRTEPWKIPTILRHDEKDVAVVTIRRPRTLNALNRALYGELKEVFEGIRKDRNIRAAVLTGFGVKAFVSGADIGMLAAVKSPEEGEALSWESQEALLFIENLGKPVVAAINGLALGGGSELAMACTARIARKGLKICFGQPEPKLGIIPGSGGTQRLPRIIGVQAAWEILRSGRTVSGKEAFKIHYLREEVDGDLLESAVGLARELGDGKLTLPMMAKTHLKIPADLPDVDIGPLSRKVDEILKKAITEGCAKPLDEGLRFESKCFGEVCGTKDKQIGIENFFKTNLKEPAPFEHA